MWVFFNDAFLSIVQNHDDADALLVRARNKGDIQRVFGRGMKVSRAPQNDYLYRATIARETVAEVIKRGLLDIDYGNFKNSIPAEMRNYHDAAFDVWTVMNRYQRAQAYPARKAFNAQRHLPADWWPESRDAEIEESQYAAEDAGVPDFVSPSVRRGKLAKKDAK